jgi:hypothetical protein
MIQSKNKAVESTIFLAPRRETLTVDGKLFYSESSQAWNVIRLKKEILHEFPQLKEKRGNFGYLMKMPTSYKDIKEIISQLEKNSDTVPILLLFCKNKPETPDQP